MKILPVVKSIQSDIVATSVRIKNASSEGYVLAKRTAGIYKQSSAVRCYNVARSVCNKVSKTVTVKELPYIAAAIGFISPFPLASPLMFCLGYAFRYIYCRGKSFSNSDESHLTNISGKQS